MLASLVIAAHDHLQDLSIPCLDAILASTEYPYELILIDDGSRDATAQYFAGLTDKAYRLSDRSGVARVRNLGFEVSSGDPIVFLDNDVLVSPGWLSILAEESKKVNVGIVGGIPSNEIDRLRAAPSDDWLIDFAAVSGACMAVNRICYHTVGHFDEHMVNYGEDYDFCYRAHLAGFRVCSTPRLIVLHRNGATRAGLPVKQMERAARRFRSKLSTYQEVLTTVHPYPFP